MEVALPPGIVKVQSEATAIGRYIDCDHVRFVSGKPEKMPGHRKMFDTQMNGVPRGLHAFLGPVFTELLAAGTQNSLYIIRVPLATVTDITPIRASSTINNNPIATTISSTTVTITDTAHGATVGAKVAISGASAVGGITISGTYTIVTVPSADSYTITHSSAATSTATGGGAAVVAAYRINPGEVSSVAAFGYGTGPYGSEDYGDERTGVTLEGAFWALDNYGDNLVACRRGNGNIYLYDDVTDTEAEILTNAPTDCVGVFVSGERFITALKENMVVAWHDQDDSTEWTPTATNTAGTRTLVGGNKLIAGTRFQRLQNLIWSDKCVFLHEYRGDSFVYATVSLGSECGLAGPAAFKVADNAVFWMSHSGFHVFTGGAVSDIPNAGDIHDYVFRNLNETHHDKVVCSYHAQARVVRFTYPHGAAAAEPNRYVEVNIDDWTWTVGTSERVGRTVQVAAASRPLLSSFEGYVYEHELSDDVNDDGAAMGWLLLSGLYRLESGSKILDVRGWSPDYERITGTHTFTIIGKDRPQSTDEDSDTASLTSATEMADVKVAGRYIQFRLEQDEVDGDFRLGTPVVETFEAGERR